MQWGIFLKKGHFGLSASFGVYKLHQIRKQNKGYYWVLIKTANFLSRLGANFDLMGRQIGNFGIYWFQIKQRIWAECDNRLKFKGHNGLFWYSRQCYNLGFGWYHYWHCRFYEEGQSWNNDDVAVAVFWSGLYFWSFCDIFIWLQLSECSFGAVKHGVKQGGGQFWNKKDEDLVFYWRFKRRWLQMWYFFGLPRWNLFSGVLLDAEFRWLLKRRILMQHWGNFLVKGYFGLPASLGIRIGSSSVTYVTYKGCWFGFKSWNNVEGQYGHFGFWKWLEKWRIIANHLLLQNFMVNLWNGPWRQKLKKNDDTWFSVGIFGLLLLGNSDFRKWMQTWRPFVTFFLLQLKFYQYGQFWKSGQKCKKRWWLNYALANDMVDVCGNIEADMRRYFKGGYLVWSCIQINCSVCVILSWASFSSTVF